MECKKLRSAWGTCGTDAFVCVHSDVCKLRTPSRERRRGKGTIQDFIDYVDDWAEPKVKPTYIVNLPALSYVRPEPLGVVCVVGTWNYPINLLLLPLVAAIGAGNCVVVRLPGDDTTRPLNNVFIELFDKYMDKRYCGNFLGKFVARAAAQHLTPTVLELGGKSPCIVEGTADLKLAAKRIAWGAFANA
ncbi:hypothetical protein PsorP6_000801 [Peronosclerospora sorghi]|uniref:Uncharacterized protein n=1 Tax=Peronosclerospora sorghi TaxID=230839 RepID=A0ACC0WTM0_9STRA|nr:hypothetical protein PsorP6_000801 [Peronosclerospora sorghi]